MDEFNEGELGISMFEYKMDNLFKLKPSLKKILKTCVYYACLYRDLANSKIEDKDKINFNDVKLIF